MKAKFDARGLLTHAASGFRERGIAGSLAWDPTPSSGLGPSLTLRQSVGVSATGGVEAVLYSDTVRRLSANDDGDELEWRRFEAVLGCRRTERIFRWLAPVAALVALCGAVPASATNPRGDLQVHGATRIGEQLRADASGITDADGGVAAVTYHWRRAIARRIRGRLFLRMCEGADCANLGTSETYLLTSSDRNKYVGVQATIIDGEGNRHYVDRALRPMVRNGGVSASESVLRVSEGESGTYEVALRSRPDDTVTVNITGHEGTDVSVNPASLAFTVDDWSSARTVTVGVAVG